MPLEEDAYDAPSDPADVGATSYEPGSSEQVSDPPHGSTPAADATQSGSPEEVLPEFDPRWREPFEGMLFVGKLQKSFTRWGHRFKIRTMDTNTIIEAGMLHKKYEGTFGAMKALQAAMLAGSLVSIDGQELPLPISSDVEELEERFHWVRKLYPWTLDVLYEEWLLLDELVQQIVEALGKAPGLESSTDGLSNVFASLNDAGSLEPQGP